MCADNVVLPTFTAHIATPEKIEVRVFKDSGSQRTFIRKDIVNKLAIPLSPRNLYLTIHGFNSSRQIDTKLIEIPLLVGEKSFNINAIVVDKLTTKFKIDGLQNVVNKFRACGYDVADNNYNHITSNIVDNIDIVLGSDENQIIPITTVCFGSLHPQSSFYNTPIGVIFTGSIARMTLNLKDIPRNTFSAAANCDVDANCDSSTNCDVNTNCDPEQITLNQNNSDNSSFSGRRDSLTSRDNSILHRDLNSPNNAVDESFSYIDEFANSQEFEKSIADLSEPLDVLTDKRQEQWETETNLKLIDFVLNNTERDSDGRLIMPITWNNKNSHLLGKNFNLSRNILFSTLKKLKHDPVKLKLYNDVFKEQSALGIIEKIENIQSFMEVHDECSYLPHMGVYRMNHDSTKCRVVFLSNLCEDIKRKISHNQAILPGPCLNHKICTAITQLRFDKFLLTFDLKKAFLNIKLRECDQNRLLFLWFKDVEKGDYSLVAYRNLRLSFGLRCSPTILMLGLYIILISDQTHDEKVNDLKKSIYNTIYMDNGSYSCNGIEHLKNVYSQLESIFSPYGFQLQQFCTNLYDLQKTIDVKTETVTPDDVKLFGMIWNRQTDSLIPNKIQLDDNANTKRDILRTINAVYDVYNLYAPLLLRARIFLQALQANKSLEWDTLLPADLSAEWLRIVKQANNAPAIPLRRAVGSRNSRYKLIAFTDASKDAYAVVIYIKDLSNKTVSFLRAKYRLVGTNCRRTIPSLELLAIHFGMEVVYETMQSLCGDTIVTPVTVDHIDMYSDSMVCLHWIQSHSIAFNKMQKLTVAVKNTLRNIDELSMKIPVTIRHIAGEINPSDCLTRPCSYRMLCKNNFIEGPQFLCTNEPLSSDLEIRLPNPVVRLVDEVPSEKESVSSSINATHSSDSGQSNEGQGHMVPLSNYSSLRFLVNVHGYVLKFIHSLKQRVATRKNITPRDFILNNYYSASLNKIISTEQRIMYPEVFNYLEAANKTVHNIPTLISQLNLFKDESGVLRVRSKFGDRDEVGFRPVLLPKQSVLTELIICDVHKRLAHSGIYPVLKELRKEFWITHYFSTVKRVLRKCIVCKKIHEPSIKLNQSDYREFRVNPINKPFSSVFLDYIGPFIIKIEGTRKKVWLLIITCLWSRAVNLKICYSLNVDDFLRAVQMHIYDFGIFQNCISDLGTQIQSGANVICTFLSDHEAAEFFATNGMTPVKFQHYPKGNSALVFN